MKKLLIIFALLIGCFSYGQNVIGNAFSIKSLTSTQRDALNVTNRYPIIYNSTTSQYERYNGSAWVRLTDEVTSADITDGTIDITGTGIKKVTLPVASTCTDQIFYITNSSDAGCSIDPDGTETINGATVQLVQIDQGYTIKSDGSNWDILNVVTL